MARRKKHRLKYFGAKLKAASKVMGAVLFSCAKQIRIDLIDIGVALVGVGIWWISPAYSLITVGALLLLLGVFLKR